MHNWTLQESLPYSQGTHYTFENCPSWGWVSLIDQELVSPDHPVLHSRRAEFDTALVENIKLRTTEKDFRIISTLVSKYHQLQRERALHDWTYISESAFYSRMNEGIPENLILDVLRARYGGSSLQVSLIQACVDAINSIIDYGLAYRLSNLEIEEDADISEHQIEIEFYFEHDIADLSMTYPIRFQVKGDNVYIEMGEDNWDAIDPHLWIHLFIDAHQARRSSHIRLQKLETRNQ